jgi:hypothetical protein
VAITYKAFFNIAAFLVGVVDEDLITVPAHRRAGHSCTGDRSFNRPWRGNYKYFHIITHFKKIASFFADALLNKVSFGPAFYCTFSKNRLSAVCVKICVE